MMLNLIMPATQFISDTEHVDYPLGESSAFVIALAQSKEYMTVNDNAKYPQFLKCSYDDNTLVPVDENINNKSTTDIAMDIFNCIINLIAKAYTIIISAFKGAIIKGATQ